MASEQKAPEQKEYAPEDLMVSGSSVATLAITDAKYTEGHVILYTLDVSLKDGKTYRLARHFTDFEAMMSTVGFQFPPYRVAHEGDVPTQMTISGLPALPTQPAYPWFVKPKLMLGIDPRDFEDLEITRLRMDVWARNMLRFPGVSSSAAWSNFLSPALRRDWPPTTGPIDLTVHDLQHETAVTEWWYWNMHFTGTDGKDYSAYFCLFAKEKYINPLTGDKYWGYAVHSALMDVSGEKYYQRSILDIDAPGILKDLIDADPKWGRMMKRAYGEMLSADQLPLPDELNDAQIPFKKELDYALLDCSCKKLPDGRYHLKMTDTKGTTGFDVKVKLEKAPVRHGFNGVTKGHGGDDMFYYFVPRASLEGSFHIEGGPETKIAKGQAWYDHEFGGQKTLVEKEKGAEMLPYSWTWCAVQLDNGYEISMCTLKDMATEGAVPQLFGKLIAPDGTVTSIETTTSFDAVEDGPWFHSRRTFQRSPLHYTIKSAAEGFELRMEAAFADQELLSIINQPGYWEGRMLVSGTFKGAPVKGLAFLERAGYSALTTLNQFFKNVGASVRTEVRKVFPDEVTEEAALSIVARPGYEYYLDAVPFDVLHKTMIEPVRSIIDRGGKSWRSFAALACIEVVGGDSRDLPEMLAMPEFLHVGSLIVDDIQDESELRRGGPSCHVQYGVPIAINAGTACYFQFEVVVRELCKKFPAETMLKCYDEYFLCLRAGHSGQALDIAGLEPMMDAAVESGDGASAEARVLATHRLKTAAPAGSLSRIGAILGGGSQEQIKAIGLYFEGVGTAFQIMDDVLNLRGLYTNDADRKQGVKLKKVGEDLEAGKVTFPVVKAISLMPKDQIRKLWGTIRTKPSDPEVVWSLIQELESVGAIEACVKQATDMVENSWRALEPLLKPSFSKLMLRAFGWFVIERTI